MPVEEQLRRMQAEIEVMRSANEAMRREIDQMRMEAGEDWLTESRADAIRAMVSDVLADADVRANLLQDGMTAGWSDHFFLASPDGRFKLELGGQFQFRYMWTYRDLVPNKHLHGWEHGRTRLTARGHVFSKDIEYMVKWGVTRDDAGLVDGIGILHDAWARFHLNNDASLKVGQFKIPFTRETLVSSSRHLAVEKSLVDTNLGVDRSQGVELTLRGADASLRFATIDAGYNRVATPNLNVGPSTSPQNAPVITQSNSGPFQDAVSEFAVAMRFEKLVAGTWEQFEDFTSPAEDPFGMMIGVAAFYQHPKNSGAFTSRRDEEPWLAGTVDLSLEWGGANAFGAFTYHYLDDSFSFFGPTNVFGVVAQGGFYVTPKVELFARFEYASVEFSGNFSQDELVLGTVGFNYYLDGHDLKWTTDLGFTFDRMSALWVQDSTGPTDIHGYRSDLEAPQIVFRTQFQLLF
jgi:hypothetical protein